MATLDTLVCPNLAAREGPGRTYVARFLNIV